VFVFGNRYEILHFLISAVYTHPLFVLPYFYYFYARIIIKNLAVGQARGRAQGVRSAAVVKSELPEAGGDKRTHAWDGFWWVGVYIINSQR